MSYALVSETISNMAQEALQPISLISGTSLNRYAIEFESDLLINAVLIPAQSNNARSPAMLTPRLGKLAQIDIPDIRGIYYSNTIKRIIVVTLTQLIVYTAAYEQTVLKTFAQEIEYRPLFEETYNDAVVWIDNVLYSIDKNINLREISNTNLAEGRLSSLTFIDGYVLASVMDSNEFLRSELNGTYFTDGLNFSKLQSNDNIVNITQLNRELFIFCERHAEVWWDSATDPDQPFTRQDGRISPIGTKSVNTVHLNGALYNVGAADDNTVSLYRWTGAGSEQLSFDLLNQKFAEANELFVIGTLENNRTIITVVIDNAEYWSYDVESKVWSKRVNWDITDSYSIKGVFYAADTQGIVKLAGSTDRDALITCEKVSSHIQSNGLRGFHKTLEIDVAGMTHGDVQLWYSDDAGRTWKNMIKSGSSTVGQYNRIRFQRLGQSRDRVYKLRWYAANIYAALLVVEFGNK